MYHSFKTIQQSQSNTFPTNPLPFGPTPRTYHRSKRSHDYAFPSLQPPSLHPLSNQTLSITTIIPIISLLTPSQTTKTRSVRKRDF